MSARSVARKVGAKRSRCVECGARLTALSVKRRAITCSASCAQSRQYWLAHKRPKPPAKTREATQPENPPILGFTIQEAAERIGVSRQMVYQLCVKHGVGRTYGGRWWLTLTDLRTLTVQPWREGKGDEAEA